MSAFESGVSVSVCVWCGKPLTKDHHICGEPGNRHSEPTPAKRGPCKHGIPHPTDGEWLICECPLPPWVAPSQYLMMVHRVMCDHCQCWQQKLEAEVAALKAGQR